MYTESDTHYMRQALAMARRGLGRVWPNPSVGCVIVKGRKVIAAARTADGGRPHAEALAIEYAGIKAKGATAFVTLEPCAHTGQTPPCAQGLINAGIARVVIGVQDVDPRVAGQGTEMLRQAGIDVSLGLLEKECTELNSGFFYRIQKSRPLVTLKTACSLDGKTALANGKSQWITGEIARKHAHQLRARHDAVMAGIGTVKSDNPLLNTRISGILHKTVRIVLDWNLEVNLESKLIKTANEYPLWIFHGSANESKQTVLEKSGVRLFKIQDKTLSPVLGILAKEGITRLMVEGGAGLHTSFLQENLCDELYIYRAPCILGGDALNAFRDLNIDDLSRRFALNLKKTQRLGPDLLEIYAAQE